MASNRAFPFLAALIGLGLAGCWGGNEPSVEVRLRSGLLASPATPDSSHSEPPLRFAYASVLSPARSTLAYARLGQYLSDRLDRPVEIVRRRTYAETNELLRTGQAQAGLVCTGAFAAGQDGFGLTAIAIPVIGGKRTYQSYIIARRDSGILVFGDLEGRTFAFTDPLSNTGFRYVADRLHVMGTSPANFFGHTVFTYGHDNSIDTVLDGLADAGSVDSLVWDELVRRNPSLVHSLAIVEQSEPFPINPFVVGPDADPALEAALTAVLLGMHEDAEGRAILADLGTDALVKPTEETLAGYVAIALSWRRLAQASGPASETR